MIRLARALRWLADKLDRPVPQRPIVILLGSSFSDSTPRAREAAAAALVDSLKTPSKDIN